MNKSMIDKNLLSKKDNRIIMLVFGIPFVFFLSFAIWSFATMEDKGVVMRKDDLAEHFNGVVDSLYIEEQNHSVKVALLNNGYKYYIFRPWEPNISVGDSLSKKINTLMVEVFKSNHQKMILSYEDRYRKDDSR